VRLQFDDLTFDLETRQIWVRGNEARLSPKAFELLALLIERRPRAVSKADIRAHLWPGTFVSDSSLPSLVSEIRDAIGDHRREPGLVRTLHGFGYAFQADATRDTKGGSAPIGPHARLVSATGEIALADGENILGREGDGILVVKSTTVSRRHARITIGANDAVVEDLGSKNGTYVNDRPVTAPTRVADGDQVRLGSLLFTFRFAPPSASTETQSVPSGTPLRP
jgi:DNA-binding winged helix-turn-helix (wHTH) protein